MAELEYVEDKEFYRLANDAGLSSGNCTWVDIGSRIASKELVFDLDPSKLEEELPSVDGSKSLELVAESVYGRQVEVVCKACEQRFRVLGLPDEPGFAPYSEDEQKRCPIWQEYRNQHPG